MELNIVLIITVLILLGGSIKGFRGGFISEVSSLLSLIVSLVVMSIFVIGVKEYMNNKYVHVIVAIVVLLIVVTVYKIVNFILTSLGIIMKLPVASGLNRILGLALGVVKSVVMIWLFLILMTYFNLGPLNTLVLMGIDGSRFLTWISENNMLIKLAASI